MNTYSADAALAAMELFQDVQYFWEKEVLKALATRSKIGRLLLRFETQRITDLRGPLKEWQIDRLLDWEVIERWTEYDKSIPQSMFDAPMTFDGYRVTETGRALARMIAAQ